MNVVAEKTDPSRGRPLRIGRRSMPGQMYLIATFTLRHPFFAGLTQARCAVRCLYDDGVARQATTLAHVVMPDHVHWVMQLSQTGELSAVVRLYKAKVSARLSQRVWQRGFHDRAVRAEEDVVSVSRYVVANPLRAGLVGQIGDYPHWDAA